MNVGVAPSKLYPIADTLDVEFVAHPDAGGLRCLADAGSNRDRAMPAARLAVPNARPDFTRFNANDSECYLALGWNDDPAGGL